MADDDHRSGPAAGRRQRLSQGLDGAAPSSSLQEKGMDVSMHIIRSELAPLGRLRVAINLGNPVLAQRAADGTLAGVSVDLAWEIAVRLGVEMELSNFATAGAAVAALQDQACDLAF